MILNTSLVALRGDVDSSLVPHVGHTRRPAIVPAADARPAAESGVERRAALYAMLAIRADEAALLAAGVRAQAGQERDPEAARKLYPPYPREYEARRARLAALEKLDAELMFRSERSPAVNSESAEVLGASIAARLAAELRATLSRQGARGPLINLEEIP
jgi:hypothetical protein